MKAYKHVRDAIVEGKKIDEKIANLVNVIPHRAYRDGFLFNQLKDFPEGETPVGSTTLDSAGPLFNRNYFGMFSDEFIEKDGKKYFHIEPKEVITPGMKIKFLSPTEMGELEIIDILDAKGNQTEKAHCNS